MSQDLSCRIGYLSGEALAEKFLNNSVEKTRVNTEKQHGTFNFVHLDSRKSHTLQLVSSAI